MLYKVKLNNSIVDALDNLQCVRFFPRSNCVLRCDRNDSPQGIISSSGEYLWHVDGWPELPEADGTVELVEISDEEYKDLMDSLAEWGTVEEPEEEEPAEQEHILTPAEAAKLIQELTATVDDLRESNSMLEECVLELSEIVYA